MRPRPHRIEAELAAGTRLHCLVPGCQRTLKPAQPGDTEGICREHWSTTSKRYRQLYNRARSIAAKSEAHSTRLEKLLARLWHRLRTEAIEQAMGVR